MPSRCPIPRMAVLGGLLLLALLAGGCGAFRPAAAKDGKPTNERRWFMRFLPPPGEYFYDERSHDIERSLRRQSPSLTVE